MITGRPRRAAAGARIVFCATGHLLRGSSSAERSPRTTMSPIALVENRPRRSGLKRCRFFDLGHDRRASAHEAAKLGHVGRALHEREGHPVDPKPKGKRQIVMILLCERGVRDDRAWQRDALVVGEMFAGQDLGVGEVRAAARHRQANAAVVDQQHRAGIEGLEQLRMRQVDPVSPTGRRVEVEAKAASRLDRGGAGLERPDTVLRRSAGRPAPRADRSTAASAARTASSALAWSSWSPWLKFSRNTSAPARASAITRLGRGARRSERRHDAGAALAYHDRPAGSSSEAAPISAACGWTTTRVGMALR